MLGLTIMHPYAQMSKTKINLKQTASLFSINITKSAVYVERKFLHCTASSEKLIIKSPAVIR